MIRWNRKSLHLYTSFSSSLSHFCLLLLSLSNSLSIYLSLFLSTYLSFYYLSLFLSIYLSLFPFIIIFLHLSLSLSTYSYIFSLSLPLSLSFSLSLYVQKLCFFKPSYKELNVIDRLMCYLLVKHLNYTLNVQCKLDRRKLVK